MKKPLAKKQYLNYITGMFSTFIFNTDDLTEQFISTLQKNYPKKRIEIFVQEAQDETEYLHKDQQLLKAVEAIKNGKNMVQVPLDSIP